MKQYGLDHVSSMGVHISSTTRNTQHTSIEVSSTIPKTHPRISSGDGSPSGFGTKSASVITKHNPTVLFYLIKLSPGGKSQNSNIDCMYSLQLGHTQNTMIIGGSFIVYYEYVIAL